jgi:UDPglucose--hexose-1-phosphate uridylyltransferase
MIEKDIANLVYYAQKHLHLDSEDALFYGNILLKIFRRERPYEGELDTASLDSLAVPDSVIEPLDRYLQKSLGYEEGAAHREIAYIMGLLSPLPSQVNTAFNAFYDVKPELATDYLYDLSIKNNYIAKTQVDKNIVWAADYSDGPSLEISINLSKPEKNNKDIAKLVSAVSSSYPKCLLCHENLGFAGNPTKAPRENIRFVPLTLDDERWYLQYSPYVYYPHHCICFYEKHVPMEISPRILSKLVAFVDQFPHFFIGSNSDLPIVGGSILDHEHFQGGDHEMPLMKAKNRTLIASPNHPKTKVHILDFYDTVIRLDGKDRSDILDTASAILSAWRDYSDPANAILAKDEQGQHNTITPIVRKQKDSYTIYLILRNNRCDATYPDGIFHAHPEYHMIKKEGIGLIEAMGLFILPARLERQGHLIEEIIANKYPESKYLAVHPDLKDFVPMVNALKTTGGSVRDYINKTCQSILQNVAVFKDTKEGQAGLVTFLKGVNL